MSVFCLCPNWIGLFTIPWFDLLGLDAALDLQERTPGGFMADLSIRALPLDKRWSS